MLKKVSLLLMFLCLMALVAFSIWSFSALDWHLKEDSLMVGDMIKTLSIILFSWMLLKFIQLAIWSPLEEKFLITIPRIIKSLTYMSLWAGVALIVTVVVFKQPLSSWLAFGSLLTAGLAIVLQNLIQDFVSGLILDAESTYEEGDWIRLSTGQEGKVINITWRLTALKNLDGQIIYVPNSTLTKETYVLLTPHEEKENWQSFTIGLDYDLSVERATRLIKTALTSKELDFIHEYQVFYLSSDAGGITYQVRYLVKNYNTINSNRHLVFQEIFKVLTAHGVEISQSLGEYALTKGGMLTQQKLPHCALDILKKCPLFHSLSFEELETLSKKARQIEIDEGVLVVKEADETNTLYIVGEGALQVVLDNQKFPVYLFEGDVFGERALFLGEKRQASIYTKTSVVLYALEPDDIRPLLENNADLARSFSQQILKRSEENELNKMEKKKTIEDVMKILLDFFHLPSSHK